MFYRFFSESFDAIVDDLKRIEGLQDSGDKSVNQQDQGSQHRVKTLVFLRIYDPISTYKLCPDRYSELKTGRKTHLWYDFTLCCFKRLQAVFQDWLSRGPLPLVLSYLPFAELLKFELHSGYGQLKAMNSKINRTGAFSLYEEVYLKTLNNIENLLNTDKDNTLAKFLVKETDHLNHKKIINFVRETEVSFNKTKVYSLCCVGRSLLYELGHII